MTTMTSRTDYSTQTPTTSTLFSGQYLRNHWTLDVGVYGYTGIVWLKEHSRIRSFPPETPYIYVCVCVCVCVCNFSVLTYPEPYIPREIALLLCNRVFLFFFKKKSWLKRKDSNLESFNYESVILPFQPTLSGKHNRHIMCTFKKLTPC